MKPAQHLYGFGHRFGREKVRTEDAFAEARDFAVFMNAVEFSPAQAGNFQSNRVGADINRSEDGHGP